ncbi:hypothetical protein D3C76_1442090 [compost metagenome]
MLVDGGDVAGQGHGAGAVAARQFGRFLQRGIRLQVHQGQVEPGLRQADSDGPADPGAGAGDQGDRTGRHARAPWLSSSRAMIVRWIWLVPS